MTTTPNKPIRVLLVDDHVIVRDGFRRLIDRCRDMQVAEEAQDGHEALEKYNKKKIDVVIMDLSMPKKSGIEAIEDILRIDPDAKIIVFTMLDNMTLISRLYEIGISAYLSKNEAVSDLIHVIREVMAGGIYFTDHVAREIALHKIQQGKHPQELLTPREYDVFKLMAMGKDAQAIAQELDINIRTVKHYNGTIMSKLHLKTPVEIPRLAIQLGIVQA